MCHPQEQKTTTSSKENNLQEHSLSVSPYLDTKSKTAAKAPTTWTEELVGCSQLSNSAGLWGGRLLAFTDAGTSLVHSYYI